MWVFGYLLCTCALYSMHVTGRGLLIESLPCSVIVLRARSVAGGVHGGGGGVEDGERDWEGEGEGDDGIEREEEPRASASAVASYRRGPQRKCKKEVREIPSTTEIRIKSTF